MRAVEATSSSDDLSLSNRKQNYTPLTKEFSLSREVGMFPRTRELEGRLGNSYYEVAEGDPELL
jgi:hypothetical protein